MSVEEKLKGFFEEEIKRDMPTPAPSAASVEESTDSRVTTEPFSKKLV